MKTLWSIAFVITLLFGWYVGYHCGIKDKTCEECED